VGPAGRAVKSRHDVCLPVQVYERGKAIKLGGTDRIQRPAGPVQRLRRVARVLAIAVGNALQCARVVASSLT
jgi:hypothetical protein